MDLFLLLHDLDKLEGGLADLYAGYAGEFGSDAEAAALFQALSREETDHRNLVQYQLRLVRESGETFGEVSVSSAPLEATLSRVAQLMLSVRGTGLGEAVRNALRFEQDAAEHYYRTAMAQASPALDSLLGALSGGGGHIERLRTFAAARGFA